MAADLCKGQPPKTPRVIGADPATSNQSNADAGDQAQDKQRPERPIGPRFHWRDHSIATTTATAHAIGKVTSPTVITASITLAIICCSPLQLQPRQLPATLR